MPPNFYTVNSFIVIKTSYTSSPKASLCRINNRPHIAVIKWGNKPRMLNKAACVVKVRNNLDNTNYLLDFHSGKFTRGVFRLRFETGMPKWATLWHKLTMVKGEIIKKHIQAPGKHKLAWWDVGGRERCSTSLPTTNHLTDNDTHKRYAWQ